MQCILGIEMIVMIVHELFEMLKHCLQLGYAENV